MNTPVQPETVGAIPWWKSGVQIAQLTALISMIAAAFPKSTIVTAMGFNDPAQVSNFVTGLFTVIGFIAILIGMFKRWYSSLQPLTLTQAAADTHPATLIAKDATPAPPVPTAKDAPT